MKRMLLLISLLLIAICLQIYFNSSGYNYFVYWLGCILIVYFDDIKSFSFATLKIEKFEKIAKYLEKTVVASWKINIDLSMFSSGGFSVPTPERFFKVIELIQKEMPQEIQDELDDYVKDKANILAIHQDRQIKTDETTQPNLVPDAKKAYEILRDIALHGSKSSITRKDR